MADEKKEESYYMVIAKFMAIIMIPLLLLLFFGFLPLIFFLSQYKLGFGFIPIILIVLIGGYMLFIFKFVYPRFKMRLARAALRYGGHRNMMNELANTPEYQRMVNDQMNSPAMQQFKEQMKREMMQEMAKGQAQQGGYSGTTGAGGSTSTDAVFEEELQKKIREMKEGI